MDLSKLAMLTLRNVDALRTNDYVLDRLEDEAIVENLSNALSFPTEFLNKMTPTGMPPHALHLKVGCIAMLLRNIDFASNGVGIRKGNQVLLPKIDCYFSHNLPSCPKRRQFPIRLSFAMTINKSQRQLFPNIGTALHDPIFRHGQLYVALSRTRSSGGMVIEAPKNLMRTLCTMRCLSKHFRSPSITIYYKWFKF
ncbi:unnamed protein product [Heligmosomoides polygyrus]|uniref:ATP-dependent DNA helicase n=1 Tax=Heligmosomoides polygyrus TaxID=6339 RepID=A0A183G415_HELPZ|nr:unnamed protein product [Heligmosomoides polygyrus]